MSSGEARRVRSTIRSIVLASGASAAAALYACSSSTGSGDVSDAGSLTPVEAASAVDEGAPVEGSAGSPDVTTTTITPDGATADVRTDDPQDVQDAGGGIPVCASGPAAPHPSVDGRPYLDASDDGACDEFFAYASCSPAPVFGGAGCYFSLAACRAICGFSTSNGCFVTADNCTALDDGNSILDAASVVVNCTLCLGGRRPADMDAFEPRASVCGSGGDVGAWFARASHLEAASIAAFRRLRAELTAHGAPRDLTDGARDAAHDEARHTRATAALARKFGGVPRFRNARRGDVRTVEEIAIENAREGCVRETFAAIVAGWQAAHASDPEVRREMTRIADDEARHAGLAWDVAAWAEEELDAPARARVARERSRAVDVLREEIAAAPPPALIAIAGLPDARAAHDLFARASQQLWS